MKNKPLNFVCIFYFLFGIPAYAYELPPAKSSTTISSYSNELNKLSDGISDISQKASTSVVFVSVSKVLRTPKGAGQFNPFEFWFPGLDQYLQNQRPQRSGIGSGFIVDLDKGYVITNNHVIDGADEISLKLANEETYDATVVGRDSNTDIAVVQINNKKFNRKGLSQLVLDNSDELKVGNFVIALGAPFGLESSISFGVISALSRGNLRLTTLGNFIQTDAAINPGNSGGPLINMNGKVVGMNTAIFSRDGGYNGIGFAVPSNLIRRISNQLIANGKVDRGYIGVSLQGLDREVAGHLGLPTGTTGALLTRVVPGGPADKAGLKQGDVITSVDNTRIINEEDLSNTIGLRSPGDKAQIEYFRNAKKSNTTITIQNFPDIQQAEQLGQRQPQNRSRLLPQSPSKDDKSSSFGLYLSAVSSQLQRQFNFSSSTGAVVVGIEPNSIAARFGIRRGDVITEVTINRVTTTIKSPADFDKAVKGKNNVLLRIEREGQFQFLGISQ